MDRRLEISLLLLAFTGTVYAFRGAPGPFSPNVSNWILYTYHFNDLSAHEHLPGFFALGAAVTLVTDVAPSDLIYYPILALPSVSVFYVLMRRIGISEWLAIGTVAVIMISNTQGSRVFFYQHGFGAVLLYTAVFATVCILPSRNRAHLLVILLTTVPLITISYNHTFRAIIFFMVIGVGIIAHHRRKMPLNILFNINVFIVLATLILIVVYLSPWFHQVFISRIAAGQILGPSHAFDTFRTLMLSNNNNTESFMSMVAHERVPLITYLGLVKHILLLSIAVSFWLLFVSYLTRYRTITQAHLITVAMFVVGVAYFVARLLYGVFSFDLLFFPALFAIATFHRTYRSPRVRKTIHVSLIALLIVSVATFGANATAGYVERTDTGYAHTEAGANWYEEYGDGNLDTDVRTVYLLTHHMTAEKFASGNNQAISELLWNEINIMSVDGTLTQLFGEGDPSEDAASYVALEHQQAYLAIEGWINMKPWQELEAEYTMEPSYANVYDSGDMEYLKHQA